MKTLLQELYIPFTKRILESYGYSDEELAAGLKKYGLKRYKNKVGKDIGGYVYFHRNYIDTYPEFAVHIHHAMKYLPNDFKWNTIKYNRKENLVTFINSPNFDSSDEPYSMDNISVDHSGNLKYYKVPKNPTIWHHKWQWTDDNYTGFDVREAKERSLHWNQQLDNHPDPKIKSRIGSEKVWRDLGF
jgi:hypothetical protein